MNKFFSVLRPVTFKNSHRQTLHWFRLSIFGCSGKELVESIFYTPLFRRHSSIDANTRGGRLNLLRKELLDGFSQSSKIGTTPQQLWYPCLSKDSCPRPAHVSVSVVQVTTVTNARLKLLQSSFKPTGVEKEFQVPPSRSLKTQTDYDWPSPWKFSDCRSFLSVGF